MASPSMDGHEKKGLVSQAPVHIDCLQRVYCVICFHADSPPNVPGSMVLPSMVDSYTTPYFLTRSPTA